MTDVTGTTGRINASPTKEFFIHMLTRDVQLTRAIIDLVDNSVDGALRLRGASSFEGLWVRIELGREQFRVHDNCGGIPVAIARDYAFRFGRPPDAIGVPGSVGLFGVGMKRTFFKLGREFRVSSRCTTERFQLAVDVGKWMAGDEKHGPDDWHFDFDRVEQDLESGEDEQIGTDILVTRLLPAVANSFALDNFVQQLITELSAAHATSLDRGLGVTVNQLPVNFLPQTLLASDQLQPVFVERSYSRESIDGQEGPGVRVRLYAGISERSLHDGGWYVFCNGRLVLKADKTSTTVWGASHGLRQYHPDLAYFRGYAYFDSDSATLLPWTTTKTGVDSDSALYKTVQQEMIEVSKPIVAYLSEIAREPTANEDDVLDQAVSTAKVTPTHTIAEAVAFRAPKVSPGPPIQWIRYARPLESVIKAKRLLKVGSYKEVGERTFEYYMEYEGKE